jgi:very-short-patch-repair endonuclease
VRFTSLSRNHRSQNTMQQHLSRYTKSLIPNSRKLRRDMTDAERKLWSLLRNNQLGVKFRRQVPYDLYILDFYCVKAKLVIEVDGAQHFTSDGKRRDEIRDADLRRDGLEVLRFMNAEVLTNSEGVEQAIFETLEAALKRKTGCRPPPEMGSGCACKSNLPLPSRF